MEHLLMLLKDTMQSVKDAYYVYCTSSLYLAIPFLALLYLFSSLKKKSEYSRQDKMILWLTALLIFVIVFPITAWFIIKYCVGAYAYRRLFWMIPVPLIAAYVATRIVTEETTRLRKVVVAAALAAIVIVLYPGMYTPDNFAKASEPYKIGVNPIAVGDALEQDALEQGMEQIRAIVPNDLTLRLREYDAAIIMPYGRDAIEGRNKNKLAMRIYNIVNAEQLDAQTLAFYAKRGNYSYLAYWSDDAAKEELLAAGYDFVTVAGDYYIYRLNMEAVSDILITQYGQNDGNQVNFYTIETIKGKLIVVDGGFETDEQYVRDVLAPKGNCVNAWILTHYHQDHVGAFCNIYKNPGGIKIGRIFAVKMESLDRYVENAKWDETYTVECFRNLGVENIKYLHAGDERKIAGVPIKVLNAEDDYVDEISNDLHNDGSLMFKVYGKTESMLFCADVGKRMSNWIIEHYGDDLPSDYLQMGHHGNGGLSEKFYRMVQPKVAFFDAPAWLFDDTEGKYTSAENRAIMEDMGARIYSFEGAPHTIQLH